MGVCFNRTGDTIRTVRCENKKEIISVRRFFTGVGGFFFLGSTRWQFHAIFPYFVFNKQFLWGRKLFVLHGKLTWCSIAHFTGCFKRSYSWRNGFLVRYMLIGPTKCSKMNPIKMCWNGATAHSESRKRKRGGSPPARKEKWYGTRKHRGGQ